MQKTVFIYTLSCPTSGQVRYVGKSVSPKKRFRGHLNKVFKEAPCHRSNWLLSLIRRGLEPTIEIIAEVPETEWQFWERSYIHLYHSLGFDLVNSSAGGDGFEAGEKHPCFGKKGKQNPNFGLKRSPEFRAHASASLKGLKRSPEFCAGIGVRAKGNLYNLGVKRKNNTSGFVGVSWNQRNENWRARIHVITKEINLGGFSKVEDAVFVRALAFDKYYGNSERT